MEFFIILYGLLNVFNPAVMEYQGVAAADTLTYVLLGISAAFFVCTYCFRAVGLTVMAKKAGKKNLVWCAFVPFASTYLMGELAGNGKLGSLRIKKIGLFVMLAEILYAAGMAVVCIPQIVAFMDYDRYITTVANDIGVQTGFSSEFPLACYNGYHVGIIFTYV